VQACGDVLGAKNIVKPRCVTTRQRPVRLPCFQAFRLPFGAPVAFPPCIRHLPFVMAPYPARLADQPDCGRSNFRFGKRLAHKRWHLLTPLRGPLGPCLPRLATYAVAGGLTTRAMRRRNRFGVPTCSIRHPSECKPLSIEQRPEKRGIGKVGHIIPNGEGRSWLAKHYGMCPVAALIEHHESW
jgi:hypothetical protein